MKNIVSLVLIFVFGSCSITEKFIILPNDQVKLSYDIDLSQLIAIGKSVGNEVPKNPTYHLNYNFPKRILTTYVKNAKIRLDLLSVSFEFDINAYERDADYLNL